MVIVVVVVVVAVVDVVNGRQCFELNHRSRSCVPRIPVVVVVVVVIVVVVVAAAAAAAVVVVVVVVVVDELQCSVVNNTRPRVYHQSLWW